VPLQAQNPTAVERKGKATIASEPASGVTTRARRRRIAAATAAVPEDILAWEIFVRLRAKDVLRCRAVCRSWRRLTSAPDFLLAHHRRQPSLPLLTLHGTKGTKDGVRIFKHGRPLLGFDDYEGFKLHASCDGLLMISLSDGRFSICNPTTRQSAPLPCLTAAGDINIAALYLHRPSGEYRVLYWKGVDGDNLKAGYYVLTVRRGQLPRCIGVPSGIDKVMLKWHKTSTNVAAPVVFRDCLHWDLGCSHAGILVFDTAVETFRVMRPPAAATRYCTHLCDMEGSIGFSCNDYRFNTVANIWVIEDYEREVWSFKYNVELPENFRCFAGRQHLVLSHKGDVLLYKLSRLSSSSRIFHFDNTGKLLQEFLCDSWCLSNIGHWFKESLITHDISLRRGYARIFQRV
jgi:F-box interacting protein